MPHFDLIVRGASPFPFVAVADGKFALLEGEGTATVEVDATGLTIFPGVIDAHVHFNEPGRADWEGLATGSRAAAAGGTTTYFDMPLNAHPPTVDAAAFAEKRALAEEKSVVDFALWGGLVPGNAGEMEALRDCGVIGYKAFMSGSGIEDFSSVDLGTLRVGMREAARLGLPVAVHAEFDHLNTRAGTSIRDYLGSRPVASEVAAIRAAIELAGETGCRLHIVHVSSGSGIAAVLEGRAAGVDVTSETCPHYLVFTDDDLERLGAVAKCAPPLRPAAEREDLLRRVRAGEVDTIGSDHSPSPASMKVDADFFKIWGGISGCQHLLALLCDLGLSPGQIAGLTASHVADRFQINHQKGRIALGLDADFALVDCAKTERVTADSLFYRHRHSPYVGRTLRGKIVHTFLRGQAVWQDGVFSNPTRGKLIIPQ